MKTELEEAAEKYAEPFDNRFWVSATFKEGAKWQAERMYSEEDLLEVLKFFIKDTRGDKPWVDADDEWFEQFKKK
jgi:hypothetical protein